MTRPKSWVPLPPRDFRDIPLENIGELQRRVFSRLEFQLSEHVCWSTTSKGYSSIAIGGARYPLHRVAYAVCHGQIPHGHHVGHKCDNKRCINPSHLEAITPAENVQQACERFLMKPPRGEKCGTAKMTREQVIQAIEECRATGHGYRRIAKRLGLPPSAVKDVLSGRSWQHLTGGKPVAEVDHFNARGRRQPEPAR